MSTPDPVASPVRVTCDMCGGARERSERHRLVWDPGEGSELVLAELCGRCAAEPGRVLEFYGGPGQDTLRLTHVHAAREARLRHTTRDVILRGLVYALVALAAFVVVTSVTSR